MIRKIKGALSRTYWKGVIGATALILPVVSFAEGEGGAGGGAGSLTNGDFDLTSADTAIHNAAKSFEKLVGNMLDYIGPILGAAVGIAALIWGVRKLLRALGR